jgi:hypothetical protein
MRVRLFEYAPDEGEGCDLAIDIQLTALQFLLTLDRHHRGLRLFSRAAETRLPQRYLCRLFARRASFL